MGPENFSFAPKFHQNGRFSTPYFVFLEESCLTRRKVLDGVKCSGEGNSSPPHHHCMQPVPEVYLGHVALPLSGQKIQCGQVDLRGSEALEVNF